MMKRFLTILPLIGCYVLFISWQILHTKELEATYSPSLTQKFLSPYVWQIDSDVDIEDLRLKSQEDKELDYRVKQLLPKRAVIEFSPLPTGCFSWVWLIVQTRQLKHKKKLFLEITNPFQAQLKIISFSPVANKKYDQTLELLVKKEGSLAGLCLQIEQPQKGQSTYYLPDVKVKHLQTWKILFCQQQKISTNLSERIICLPLLLSKTCASIALIERPQNTIQDMLIYRGELSKSYNGWGTKSFEEAIKRLKTLAGFNYPLKDTITHILLTRGVRAKEKLIRQNTSLPFNRENCLCLPR